MAQQSPVPHDSHTLFCTEPNCRLPVGRLVNSSVMIVAKHHGEKHYTTIPLATLLRIAANIDTKLLTEREKLATLRAESVE